MRFWLCVVGCVILLHCWCAAPSPARTMRTTREYASRSSGRAVHHRHSHRHRASQMSTTTSPTDAREMTLKLNYSATSSSNTAGCPLEGNTGNLMGLIVEYRTTSVVGAPWNRLANLEIGTADVDNLLTFNVSVADNYVQFQMIQLEHGGGECDCWNIMADLLSNGHLSMFGLENRLCFSSSAFEVFGGAIKICGRSASIPRGYITYPISLSSGNICDSCDCPQIDERIYQNANCQGINRGNSSYIEIRFVLSYVIANCDPPGNLDEGIEFSVRSHEGAEWIPLAFYGMIDVLKTGAVDRSKDVPITTASVVFTTDEFINIRGNIVPLVQDVRNISEHVVQLCDENLVTSGVQFRWIQSASHPASHPPSTGIKSGWYLDNITIAGIGRHGECSNILSETFETETQFVFLESPRWGEIVNKSHNQCMTAESNVLLFGVNIPPEVGVSSRGVITSPLNFSCFDVPTPSSINVLPSSTTQPVSYSSMSITVPSSSQAPSPTPHPQSQELVERFNRLQKLISEDPVLSGIQNLTLTDPEAALEGLSHVVDENIEEVDTTAIVLLLSNIVDAFTDGTPSEEFADLVVEVSNDIITSVIEPEPDQDGVTGSTLISLLDRLAFSDHILLKSDNDSNEAKSRLTSTNIELLVQYSVHRERDDSLLGVEKNSNSIHIPPAAFRRPVNSTKISVASFVFNNLSSFLPGSLSNTSMNESSKLISSVISSILQCDFTDCDTDDLDEKVVIMFDHKKRVGDEEIQCVFWDFINVGGPLVDGQWSSGGCEVDKKQSSLTTTVCLCDHLTHFGVLLSPTGSQLSEEVQLSLQVIGYISVAISLVTLTVTIFTFIVLRPLWNMRNYIHVNLCISLLIAQLIFVIGIDKTRNQAGCQAVAVLLHYSFLVSFMWMLMEGVVLYISLVRVFIKHKKRYIAAFTITSYGLPLLYMALCVPLGFFLRNDGRTGYGYQEACWLRYDTYFIWSFIAPVILIILFNIGFFVMALTIMYRHQKRQRHATAIATAKHWIKVSVSLVLVMGFTWVIGMIQFHEVLQLTVSYLFTIFIGLQSVLIFVLFVPLSNQVREAYAKWWKVRINESDFLSKHFGDKSFASNTAMTAVRSTAMSPTERISKATATDYSVVDKHATTVEGGIINTIMPSIMLPTQGQIFNIVLQTMQEEREAALNRGMVTVSPDFCTNNSASDYDESINYCQSSNEALDQSK